MRTSYNKPMQFGNLNFKPVTENEELISAPTLEAIKAQNLEDVLVSEINPELSDTAAFCEEYQIALEDSVNCVILEAKRGDRVWYAACLIQATKRADVNGIVRKELDARKISFAPMEKAVSMSGMEFGAINPIGLPEDWMILVDSGAAQLDRAIIGSGKRNSKLLVPGSLLSTLPNTRVLNLTKE